MSGWSLEIFRKADLRPANTSAVLETPACVKREMGPQNVPLTHETKWPAAARNLIPLSRFPQGESRGGESSPHAAARAAPAKTAGTAPSCGSPRKRGFAPLARSPDWSQPMCCLPLLGSERGRLRARKRIKDGRHVGLDFYDLLLREAFNQPHLQCGRKRDRTEAGRRPVSLR